MEDYKIRLQQLKQRRRMASNSNLREVLEENERSKRASSEKKISRDLKRIENEEEKQKAEESGQNYELNKSLNYQADELDKWERACKKRDNPTRGFIDFEFEANRQYSRLTRRLHKRVENEVGADKLEEKDDSRPVSSLILDSKEGVEKMVEDVNKQIEVRSKRSRRRRFDDEADVDYINERNMRFNKKLERFYGSYTDEIKQNFERGTAM